MLFFNTNNSSFAYLINIKLKLYRTCLRCRYILFHLNTVNLNLFPFFKKSLYAEFKNLLLSHGFNILMLQSSRS